MVTSGSDAQVLACSTVGVPQAEAFEAWRGMISDTFVPLTAVPTTGNPFRGELRVVTHPAVQMTEVRASGQHVRRTRQLIAGSTEDFLLASIQLGGRGQVEQDGRTADLTPGSMGFYDSTRPYTLHFDDVFAQLVFQVPRRPVLAAGITDEAVRVTAITLAADGLGSVLAGFFPPLRGCTMWIQWVPGSSVRTPPDSSPPALRLAGGERPVGSAAAVLDRERVLAYLREHAGDPGLGADEAAAACHLSRRALFRLFEGQQTSWADTLRSIRVERAAQLLLTQPQRSVAAVGAACGFAGEAQFHRAFRDVTGTAPAEHRVGTQR